LGCKKFELSRLNPIFGQKIKWSQLTPSFGKMIGWNPLCPMTKNLGVEPAEPRGLQNTFKWNNLAWTCDEKEYSARNRPQKIFLYSDFILIF
jgi:hypothetical protein